MAYYDNIEHEGDEAFKIQNRTNEKQTKKQVEQKKEQLKIDMREQQQKEWLSIDNPFLWDNLV
jgi:hypothetical protein